MNDGTHWQRWEGAGLSPPSPLANEDRELTSAASCLPPSPPSSPLPAAQVPGEPLQAAHDARAHEHIAWRALGRVTATPGPPPEGGLGPRHTHPVRGHTRSELYMHKHTHKYTLTLNRHFEPNSFSLSHTHTLSLAPKADLTHTMFSHQVKVMHLPKRNFFQQCCWRLRVGNVSPCHRLIKKKKKTFLSHKPGKSRYVTGSLQRFSGCSPMSRPSKLNHYFFTFTVIFFCWGVVHVVILYVVPHKYHLLPTRFRKSFEIVDALCLDTVVGRAWCGLIKITLCLLLKEGCSVELQWMCKARSCVCVHGILFDQQVNWSAGHFLMKDAFPIEMFWTHWLQL